MSNRLHTRCARCKSNVSNGELRPCWATIVRKFFALKNGGKIFDEEKRLNFAGDDSGDDEVVEDRFCDPHGEGRVMASSIYDR